MDTPQFNSPSRSLSGINAAGFTTTLAAGYQWTAWNPSDVIGTVTNAPGTGTADTSAFATPANASGTVTITFNKAGKYIVSITGAIVHGNVYTFDRLTFNLGGTATRRTALTAPSSSGVPSQSSVFTQQFLVSATAGQTLTILPTLEVSGSGATAQHTGHTNVTALYAGG